MDYVYLNAKEVCARWRGSHSHRTLANWRSQGKGPPVTRIAGRAVYRLDLLEKWERENTETMRGK